MADVARPRLAEVLAALTDLPADVWVVALAERSPGWHTRPILDATRGVRLDFEAPGMTIRTDSCTAWTITDPAEAQETLVARGLLPEGWCDPDYADRWLCGRCDGKAYVALPPTRGRFACGTCEGAGACDVPAGGIPDLVAVASLGWPAIQRAEEIAGDACAALREYGCPQPERVVWRVGYRMLPGDFAWRLRGTYGVQRDGAASFPGGVVGPVRPVAALWEMGLALDAITADAVRIVVPPVGGVQ